MSARIDVQAIVIGLDHAARARVQGEMRAIAERGDTRTKDGLARMLHEAIEVLLAEEASFTHAHAEGGALRSPEDAKKHFAEVAQRARSRFAVETIRAADGTITRAPAPAIAATDEPGVVLVTIVVASRSEIADVLPPVDRAGLRAGLAALGAIGGDELVALEVIWSPAEDADRVSAEDIARRHPEIRRLA